MSFKGDNHDPKGLIFEAYRIEGITQSECRSIFLDWALSLGTHQDAVAELPRLLEKYAPSNPDHPMTQVLTEGAAAGAQPRRKGGWRARNRDKT